MKLSYINKWLGIPVGSFFVKNAFNLPMVNELYKFAEDQRDFDNERFSTLLKAIGRRVL